MKKRSQSVSFLLLMSVSSLGVSACQSGEAIGASAPFQQNPATPVLGTAPAPPPTAVRSYPSPRPSTASNENICVGSASVSGLDVSDADPGTVWPTVHSSGRSFVFVKATEGTTITNPDFATDWAGAKAAGMIRGAYHYFHPELDALTQANFFVATVGALGASDLPAVLDWEETGSESAAIDIQNALIWLTQVESATGKTPMVYVDPSFFNTLGNPVEFARFPLFIAHYEVSCPAIPPPWSAWTFWQQGQVAIDGVQASAVDEDLFNGSQAQLSAFSALPVDE